MKLLEECYADVLLNERLKNININPIDIKKELDREYAAYMQREGSTGSKVSPEKFKAQGEEENVIKTVLTLMPFYDDIYKRIIEKFKTNPAELRKAFALTDKRWQNSINTSVPKNFLQKQPANLTLINLLNKLFASNVRVPVMYNEEGFPVYPYHLINKFLAMNILEEMVVTKQIDDKLKKFIESIIFDERTRKAIEKEIDAYMQRTKNNPEEVPVVTPQLQ